MIANSAFDTTRANILCQQQGADFVFGGRGLQAAHIGKASANIHIFAYVRPGDQRNLNESGIREMVVEVIANLSNKGAEFLDVVR